MLRRTRPKLPKVPEEMQQWSELLLHEILHWPQVTSRPMFGMTAVYRKNAIFGVLPRTRAMGTKYSISFKIPQRTPKLYKLLNADARITANCPGRKMDFVRAAVGRRPAGCYPLVHSRLPMRK